MLRCDLDYTLAPRSFSRPGGALGISDVGHAGKPRTGDNPGAHRRAGARRSGMLALMVAHHQMDREKEMSKL